MHHVKIEVGPKCTITGTNVETIVTSVFQPTVLEPGVVCIPSDKLMAIVKGERRGNDVQGPKKAGCKSPMRQGRRFGHYRNKTR